MRRDLSQSFRNVLDIELGQPVPGELIELLVIAITLAHHLKFIKIPTLHLMHIVLERFNDLMLFYSRHEFSKNDPSSILHWPVDAVLRFNRYADT